MGIFFRKHTGLYTVPEMGEVDKESFIDHILRLIVEKDIPRLYPGEEHQVTIQMGGGEAMNDASTFYLIEMQLFHHITFHTLASHWTASDCLKCRRSLKKILSSLPGIQEPVC
jgi:hypothetical protein